MQKDFLKENTLHCHFGTNYILNLKIGTIYN